jgi:hypothetical protein
MSTEDESESNDSGSSDTYKGTRMGSMRTNAMGMGDPRMNNIYTSPGGLDMSIGSRPDDRISLGMFSQFEQPTIWEAVNYPREEQFEFDSYYLRYTRQAEAKAIIDKPVNDTWQEIPTVHDEAHQDQDKPVSEFERKVREFFEGEHTRRKPIHRLNVLDRMARLGHYSILVLGFSDGRDMDTPVGGVTKRESLSDEEMLRYENDPMAQIPNGMGEAEFDDLDDMMYLAVFGEDRVQDMRTNSDMTSPRFRLPEEFDVVTEEAEEHEHDPEYDNEKIHWTRVIHVPEGTLEDDLRGIPALKPVFHDLLNVDKIKAASGEGYWRAGYQGLHVRPPQDSQGRFMEFENDGDDVKDEINDFIENFDRTLSTPAEINPIDSSVGNPMPHLEANYQSIAAATDIPKSILTGEDRADTASADDFSQYKSFIAQRRNNYAGPAIIEPIIQRLIDTGVLPEPDGDGFTLEWPPLDELSPTQEWQRRKLVAETIATLAPGGDTSILSNVGELRQAIGWGPSVGSEVDEIQQERARESESQQEAGGETETVDGELGSSSDFPFSEELYEAPEEAESRASELGLDGEYHVRRFDDGAFYVPGENMDALERALDTQSQTQQGPEGTGGTSSEGGGAAAESQQDEAPETA